MDEQRLKESMLEDDNIEIDLSELIHDFLKILKDYWGLFLGTIVICTIAFSTFRYLTYTPIYRCEATFTVATDSENTGSYSYYYSQNTADQLSKTFPYILDSSYFRSILLEELGVNSLNGTLSASTVSESNIVTMSVESNSPQDAMSILTSAIEVYPDAARFVLGQIQFHMINNPQLPTSPYNKLTFTNTVIVGGIIGLVFGTVILGCMALFRKTVKNPEDMKRITNLNCMATIPRVKFKARKIHKQTRISINDRRIPFAFKEICDHYKCV
ncbi:MAG: YveK family protein [Thomasclavelia spiroformis]